MLLPAVAAAAAAAESSPGAAEQTLSLWQIIQLGGILMWPLGALSVLGLTLVAFYLFTLRREQIVPTQFTEEANRAARHQGMDGLEAVCQQYDCPASRAILAGIQHIRISGDTEPQLVLNAIQSEGGRQAERLWRRIQYLLDIGVISPLVGLMGTVFGMIRAFNAIYLQYGTSKPVTLAGGVAEALITTAAGLVIAVPSMLLYSYFRGRTAALITQMEEVCARLSAHLLRGGQPAPRETPPAEAAERRAPPLHSTRPRA